MNGDEWRREAQPNGGYRILECKIPCVLVDFMCLRLLHLDPNDRLSGTNHRATVSLMLNVPISEKSQERNVKKSFRPDSFETTSL